MKPFRIKNKFSIRIRECTAFYVGLASNFLTLRNGIEKVNRYINLVVDSCFSSLCSDGFDLV